METMGRGGDFVDGNVNIERVVCCLLTCVHREWGKQHYMPQAEEAHVTTTIRPSAPQPCSDCHHERPFHSLCAQKCADHRLL